jgi:UDP-4-amino-4,6-dideoxy-N-acetyl-beta-L-altrosamine N-acetyltransferase
MSDVVLVDIQEEDLELIRNWRNSEAVAQYMYTTDHITAEQQQNWFKKIGNDPNSRYWLITYEGKKMGVVSVTEINRLFDSCFWGFYLGEAPERGAGIGKKVEYQILNYVFHELKLNKLRGEVFEFNTSVIAMHEKFGFRREAFYRQHIKRDGKYVNVVGIGILREEWLVLQDVMKKKIYG